MIVVLAVALTLTFVGVVLGVQARWDRLRTARLRSVGMEPCARCGIALRRPINAVMMRGPLLCRCCAGPA